jgi:hypothetical protein
MSSKKVRALHPRRAGLVLTRCCDRLNPSRKENEAMADERGKKVDVSVDKVTIKNLAMGGLLGSKMGKRSG